MAKQKDVTTESGATVHLTFEVLDGRHIRFHGIDPVTGERVSHTATIGAEDEPVQGKILTDMQAELDTQALIFAEMLDRRRIVAENLAKLV